MSQLFFGFLANWPLLLLHGVGYLLVSLMLPESARKTIRHGSVYVGGSLWFGILSLCVALNLRQAAAPVAMLLLVLSAFAALYICWRRDPNARARQMVNLGKHVLFFIATLVFLSIFVRAVGIWSDSYRHVTQGLNWIELGAMNAGGAAWVRTYGSWVSGVHALSYYTPNALLSLLHPVLAFQLLSMLASACWAAAENHKQRLGLFVVACGVVAILILGSSFYRSAVILINNNLPTGGLVFIAAYTAVQLLALNQDELRWPGTLFEAFCWASAAIIRIEMLPLAAAGLMLSTLQSNGARSMRAVTSLVGFSLPLIAWVVRRLVLDSSGRTLLRDPTLYAYAVIATLPFVFALLIHRRQALTSVLRRLVPWLLVLLIPVLVVLKPSLMTISLDAMVENMTHVNRWGWIWPMLFLIWMFVPPGKDTTTAQRFLHLYTGVVLVYIIAAVFFRVLPYRVGMFDSGSRMLLHALPLGILVLFSRMIAPRPPMRMVLRRLTWVTGAAIVVLVLDLFAIETKANSDITNQTEIGIRPAIDALLTDWDRESPLQMPSSDTVIELRWDQPVVVGALHLVATTKRPKFDTFFLEDDHGGVNFERNTYRSRRGKRNDILFIEAPRAVTSMRINVDSRSSKTAFRQIQIYALVGRAAGGS